MRIFWTLLLIVFSCLNTHAQTLYQNIRGKIVDKDSKKGLAGATIAISGGEQAHSTLSDTSGLFVLRNVPTGRLRLQSSYIGYQTYLSDDIILNSAKEPEVVIEMEEDRKMVQGVVVRAYRNPKLPMNKYAIVSGRSFSPEETQRFAASANDPSRMALGFPGVQATRDTRSDIVIRGNNPVGMQWRLEGVDVVNPNHFARKGSTGGGITILSLSMLDQSDFLTGAMPAEYGDALSGVFDMHFRKGNSQKTEYTFKAGMIGLDFSTEGPIQKGQSSYLVNYRYSTLGLLHALGLNLVGERESNTFQDLSFNLAFSNKSNRSQWNLWGIGGYSKETYAEVENTQDWKQYDDYAIYDFRTKMGAMGIGNTTTVSGKAFILSSLAVVGQQVTFIDDTLNIQKVPSTVNNEKYANNRVALTSSYNQKFSGNVSLKAGFTASDIFYKFRQDKMDYTVNQYRNFIDGNGSSWLLQPYTQMSIKAGNFTLNPGVQYLYFTLNNTSAIDPRLSVAYRLSQKQTLSVAYGLHSKILPLGSYFYNSRTADPYPNKNLEMMRAHHFVLAYDQLLGMGWRLHTEGYYQRLFQVPVVNNPDRTFWLLNELDGYAKEALVSKGKGVNKGVDVTLEKFFSKGWFMIGAFSVFRSTFEPLNGKTYNTRFNSGSTGSWTGAKEWRLVKNKVFQAGWKMVYNGGLPLSPLAAMQDGTREPVLDETRPYSEKVSPYFRTDARFSLRKDKAKVAWQLALDVQNIFAIRNTDGMSRRYDPSVNQWVYQQQSGLVPVLSYQIDF